MNSFKQFPQMFSAQIKMMFREKQVWFWNIFFPIILMVIFMIIFGGNSTDEFTSANGSTYTDFLLTGMIGLSLAQSGLFGMVDLVDMRRKGILKRLRMTPARMGFFGLSSMLVRLMLGVIQMVLLSLVGIFGFGATLNIHFLSLLIAFFCGTIVFSAIGYLFSSVSKSIEAYMGLANITSMLMMFLSGVFFPVASLPEWLQSVPKMLPLSYFVDGMRDGLIFANGPTTSEFWTGMGIMGLWGVACFLVAAQIYKAKSITATR